VVAAPLIGGAFLDFFQGRSDGDNITLEWRTRAESSVALYKVERRATNMNDFVSIADIPAKGSNSSYQYIDRAAYKASETIYVYRLRIVDQDASAPPAFSQEIRISHNVSGVKRTWGSIKAMFR
jgi:hypothetical protein